jgi:hypothetical protein
MRHFLTVGFLLMVGCGFAKSTDVDDLEKDVQRLEARLDSLLTRGDLVQYYTAHGGGFYAIAQK